MKGMRSAIFILALAAGTLFAQADPPSRVARLNLVDGEVSFLETGTADWVAAPLNRPLTIGDAIWTETGARAELHIGSAALRLAPETSFSFLNLDDSTVQLRLAQGSLNIRLRDLDDGEVFEIDTPHVAFRLTRPGSYRFDVRADGSASRILVWAGDGDALAGNQQFSLRARDAAEISGYPEVSYNITAVPAPDTFDEWARSRDRREDRSASSRYLSRDVTGYEDLDDYGEWSQADDYGPVWMPRVDADWAPYHSGRWAWIEPWGWTWIDDAPWGYAPFHYGRWVHVHGRWAWVPGPLGPGYRRPVYAPALVVWVGGPRWQVGISIGGGIGWFPLGPGDVYHPRHTYSERYFSRVNSSNARFDAVVLNNAWRNRDNMRDVRYRNQDAPRALTIVSRPDFERGHNVGRSAVNLPQGEASRAPIARGNDNWLGSRPARQAQDSPSARRPPDSAVRPVVTRSDVPAASGRMVRPVRPGRAALRRGCQSAGRAAQWMAPDRLAPGSASPRAGKRSARPSATTAAVRLTPSARPARNRSAARRNPARPSATPNAAAARLTTPADRSRRNRSAARTTPAAPPNVRRSSAPARLTTPAARPTPPASRPSAKASSAPVRPTNPAARPTPPARPLSARLNSVPARPMIRAARPNASAAKASPPSGPRRRRNSSKRWGIRQIPYNPV